MLRLVAAALLSAIVFAGERWFVRVGPGARAELPALSSIGLSQDFSGTALQPHTLSALQSMGIYVTRQFEHSSFSDIFVIETAIDLAAQLSGEVIRFLEAADIHILDRVTELELAPKPNSAFLKSRRLRTEGSLQQQYRNASSVAAAATGRIEGSALVHSFDDGCPSHPYCGALPVGISKTRNPALDVLDDASGPRDWLYHYTCDGSGVDVYVIDSGVRRSHEALRHAIDGGGLARNYEPGQAWDNVNDCYGHGTGVTSQIAGINVGPATGVNIIPLRVYDCNGKTTNEMVVQAVDYAIKTAASRPCTRAVINFSGATANISQIINTCVDRALQAGLLWVSAAGNAGMEACGVSPGGSPSSLTVGAVDPEGYWASFSNYGPCVHLSAVGMDNLLAGIEDDANVYSGWDG